MKLFKKHVLLSLILSLLFYYKKEALSQPNKIDSILSILKTNPKDLKAKVELARLLLNSNPDTSLLLLNQAINSKGVDKNTYSKALRLKANYYNNLFILDTAVITFRKCINFINANNFDEKEIALIKTYTDFGQTLYRFDMFKNAIDTLTIAKELTQKTKNFDDKIRQLAIIYFHFGQIYKIKGIYDKAFEALTISDSICNKNNLSALRGSILMALADTKNEINDPINAIKFCLQAKRVLIEINDKSNLRGCLNNLGSYYKKTNNFDSASYFNTESIKTHFELTQDSNYAPYYQLAGNIAKDKGLLNDAIINFNKAIEIGKQLQMPEIIAENEGIVGQILIKQHKFENAKPLLIKALEFYKSNEALVEVNTIYKDLAQIENLQGNYKKSVEYWQLHDSTLSALIDKQKIEAISQQEIKYETALKQSTIEQQQTEISLQKQHKKLLVGLAILLISLSTIVYLLYKRQKQKAINEKQKAQLYVMQIDKLMTTMDMIEKQNDELQSTKVGYENRDLLEFTKDEQIEVLEETNYSLPTLKTIKTPFDKIYYFKADMNYVEVWGEKTDKRLEYIRISFNNLIKQLPSNFLKVHRSYIVNINYVKDLKKRKKEKKKEKTKHDVLLNNDVLIPIVNENIEEIKREMEI